MSTGRTTPATHLITVWPWPLTSGSLLAGWPPCTVCPTSLVSIAQAIFLLEHGHTPLITLPTAWQLSVCVTMPRVMYTVSHSVCNIWQQDVTKSRVTQTVSSQRCDEQRQNIYKLQQKIINIHILQLLASVSHYSSIYTSCYRRVRFQHFFDKNYQIFSQRVKV